MIRRAFLAAGACLALSAPRLSRGAGPGPGAAWSPPDRFDPARDGAADVAAAVALAAKEGKRVILDVGGEWCVWCRIMDRFVESNADLRALRGANFVWLRINYSPGNRNEALLAQFPKVQGYPHLFVLYARGRLLHSQDTSELESGKSYDLGRFRAFLERWSPGMA